MHLGKNSNLRTETKQMHANHTLVWKYNKLRPVLQFTKKQIEELQHMKDWGQNENQTIIPPQKTRGHWRVIFDEAV